MEKPKQCIIKSVSFEIFELITYENAKTHQKHTLWRNRTTLRQTCVLSVFFILLGKKTPKMHAKYPIYGMEIIVYYECFSAS